MTALLQREMQEVFYMFYCGLAVMVLFYLRDIAIRRWKQHKKICQAVYLLSWLWSAFLFCSFSYQASYGVINWYGLLSFGCGIILWKKWICGILNLNKTAQKYIGDTEDEKENKRARKKV